MELYLLDEHAQRIAVIPEYESLSWRTGLLSTIADLKAPVRCFEDLVQARYLERSDSNTILFIDKKRVVGDGADRGSYLSAYDPVELLKRRILIRTHDMRASRLEMIRRLIEAGTRPAPELPGQDRSIPLMAGLGPIAGVGNGPPPPLLSEIVEQQMSWDTVYERIESILEGYPLRFFSQLSTEGQGKSIVPLLYEGKDLSREVIVSTVHGDLSDVEYSFESADRANTAIVAGQGDNRSRLVTSARINLDVAYGELFVDADNIGADDGTEGGAALTPAQQRARLQARGREYLHEQPCEHALTGSISQERFQYGIDYQVGDRIGFEAFGVRHDDIVSEVEEVFEGQRSRTNITIGQTYPTIRKIIERSTS